MLASGNGYWDRTLRLWNVATGQQHATFMWNRSDIESVAFSPDGTILAAGGLDNTIQLWDPVTGQHKDTLTGHTDFIRNIVFSPDGNTLASASQDETVRLWDVPTGQLKNTLTGHDWNVFGVAFSPDGRTLASGGYDKIVRLWDVPTGQLKDTLVGHTEAVRSVAFNPDGTTLASAGYDGTVLLWEFTSTTEPSLPGDINHDGVVNVLDLTLVGSNMGRTGQNNADVNGDDVVDIIDLVQVAGMFSETTISAAPMASLSPDKGKRGSLSNLNRDMIQTWLDMAHAANDDSLAYQRGIAILKQLLAALTPQKTALLPNYPNPFNPETWIPYRLAHAADVTLTIYDTKGAPVRQFDLGYQSAGAYTNRAKAAYWDGRLETGEPATSGVYFYSLSAGDYSATRKLLILK